MLSCEVIWSDYGKWKTGSSEMTKGKGGNVKLGWI